MSRRLNSIRDLFDRQCEFHKVDYWSAFLLPLAKKIAAGERLTFHVSQRAKREDGQASEETQKSTTVIENTRRLSSRMTGSSLTARRPWSTESGDYGLRSQR
jgi:hypothetical protein